MSKELARYLTILIANDLDSKTGGMNISNFECEGLEESFMRGDFKNIEIYLKTKLGGLKK